MVVRTMTRIEAWECDHSQMTECCDGCGHFSCPCGIYWDEGAEGHFTLFDEYDPSVFDGYEDMAMTG